MSQTMLAARAYAGEATFRLEEVPVPQIGPGEVLVEVAAGITRGLLSQWRIPGAKTGEKYTVKVLALGTNPYTQRTEATIQKVSAPE